jgi:PAS domain S-box-containing protein
MAFLKSILSAVGAPAGFTLLGFVLRPYIPESGLLVMYIPVVAALAYFGGLLAGLITALLSVLLTWYFILPPSFSFAVSADFVPTLALFGLASFVVATGFGWVREAEAKRREAERARFHLAAIVESSDDAIYSKTLDGTILTWNEGAGRLYGYSRADVIGRSISMLAPPDRPDEIKGILARLKRGEHIQHHESVRVRKDGTRFDVSLTISPVKDSSGRILGASTIGRDISDRKQFERQQRFLAEASEVLMGSLDVDTTLEALARLTVPSLADWCAIDLVQEDGRLHRVVTAHRDPAKEAWGRTLADRYPPDPQSPYGVSNVIRTAKPELYPEITDELLTAAIPDPELRETVRALGLRSAVIAPLVSRAQTLGAITFVSDESGRRYSGADLALAEELAHRAALAVENARLHHAEQRARHAAEQAADRIGRLQGVTVALSEAITPEQTAEVIVTQAVRAL